MDQSIPTDQSSPDWQYSTSVKKFKFILQLTFLWDFLKTPVLLRVLHPFLTRKQLWAYQRCEKLKHYLSPNEIEESLNQGWHYDLFKNPCKNSCETSSRSRIFLFSLVNMLVCVSVRRLLATTKKDTDLKFGTHTPIDLIKIHVSWPGGRGYSYYHL